jgi:hypothetical protein
MSRENRREPRPVPCCQIPYSRPAKESHRQKHRLTWPLSIQTYWFYTREVLGLGNDDDDRPTYTERQIQDRKACRSLGLREFSIASKSGEGYFVPWKTEFLVLPQISRLNSRAEQPGSTRENSSCALVALEPSCNKGASQCATSLPQRGHTVGICFFPESASNTSH